MKQRPRQSTARWQLGLADRLSQWFAADVQPRSAPRTDFGRLCEQVRPADVILVEGRSRVAGVIQTVTLSSWTHAALYIGRVDALDSAVARRAAAMAGWTGDTRLLVEAEIGQGVHLSPLTRYRGEHLRLCRARELTPEDASRIIRYACARLGTPYDTRQLLDLFRFFFPYGLMPRRWRSTLFEAGHGDHIRVICSTLLGNAFASVRYPILPTIIRGESGEAIYHHRNSRLLSPRDFDYSPYFDIIKYPFFGDDVARYRELVWDDDAPRVARPTRSRRR